jgi:Na+/H+ antiporter NhaD/arsenite permease-like protein
MQEIFAVALFAVILLVIAFELVHRTVLALLGAALLISLGIVHQEQAATEFID